MSQSPSTEKNNTYNNYDTTVEQDGKQNNEPPKKQSSCLSTPPKPILKSTEKYRKPVCTPEFPIFKSKVCRELSYKPTD